MPFPDAFETERLTAERLTAAHLPELDRMNTDAVTMAFIGGVRSAAQTLGYLERGLRHWETYGFGMWILRDRANDAGLPVGRAVLRHIALAEGQDDIETGYAFYPSHWGRGLATEIATACVGFARESLRVPGVVALTDPKNAASQHVLRKAGLSWEAEITWEGLPSTLFRVRWESGGAAR